MSAETTPGGVPASASQPPFGKKWIPLIKAIKQGNCVLVLGPRAALDPINPEKPILPVQLAQNLESELLSAKGESPSSEAATEAPRIPLDHLAQISTRYVQARETVYRDLLPLRELAVEFYEPFKDRTTTLHENLARVPFRVCLCTTPDSMLRNAFKKVGKSPVEDYYSITQQRHALGGSESNVRQFTPQQPLVYHLMGSVEELDSLLLTEDDLMDLPICLMKKETALPQALTDLLQSAKNPPVFLFLGFGFSSNYSRFLIKLLCGIKALPRDGHLPQGQEIKPYYVEDSRSDDGNGVMMFDMMSTFCRYSLEEFAKQLRAEFTESAVPAGEDGASGAGIARSRPMVFLCHCSDDKDRIAWMPDVFKQHDIDCWFDKDQLRGGDRWDDKIQRVIQKEIDYFVIVASNSMKKYTEHYFFKEINAAIERYGQVNKAKRIFILPVVIDDSHNRPGEFVAEINNDLDGLQCTDLFHDPERRNFEGLVKDILEDFKKRNGNT
jgi:hypothetical protein